MTNMPSGSIAPEPVLFAPVQSCSREQVVALGGHPCLSTGQPCGEAAKLDVARKIHEERDSRFKKAFAATNFAMTR